jgi:hypothetical protein
MTAQEGALAGIAAFLERAGVPYMVIGGIANLVWGEPRATLDIDVTVLVDAAGLDGFIERLGREYRVLVPDPSRFVRDTRVLPVEDGSGVRIDVLFGLLSFEEEAVRRAIAVETAGRSIRVCTPEDLILLKIISDRPRDLDDARAIIARRRHKLDLAYLEPRVVEMSRLLERDDILARWREWTTQSAVEQPLARREPHPLPMAGEVPIPVTLQVEAMVNGQVDLLLKARYGYAPIDPRPYLTATRADVDHYFREHPDLAQAYYDRQHSFTSDNDIHRIETDGQSYTVAYLDHGKPRDERRFDTLAGAVSEHLLREYGMPLS